MVRPNHASPVRPQRWSISSGRTAPSPPAASPPAIGRASVRNSFLLRIRRGKSASPERVPLGRQPTARDARRHPADLVLRPLQLFFEGQLQLLKRAAEGGG